MDNYTGLGLASQGIGGALGSIGSVISQQAMADAYAQEIAKQKQFQTQAMGVFNQYLPQVGAAGASQVGTANRLAAYNQAGPLIPGVPTGTRVGSGIANQTLMKDARAKNMGYGDIPVAQGLALQQQQQQLTPIIGAAGSEARNVFPLAMYSAQNTGLPYQQAGAGIGQIGGALSLLGLYNRLGVRSPQIGQGLLTGPGADSSDSWKG